MSQPARWHGYLEKWADLLFPSWKMPFQHVGGKAAIFAIGMLREIDPVRAIDPLIEALSNHDIKVREAADG